MSDVLKAGHGARLSCVWCCPEQDRAAHCRVLREAPAHLYLLVDGSSFFEQSLGPGAVSLSVRCIAVAGQPTCPIIVRRPMVA